MTKRASLSFQKLDPLNVGNWRLQRPRVMYAQKGRVRSFNVEANNPIKLTYLTPPFRMINETLFSKVIKRLSKLN